MPAAYELNQRPPAEVAPAPSRGLPHPPALLVVADLDVKDLEPAVQRAVGLGGTKLDEISEYGITWAVMADPDGNEFCLVKHS